MALRRAVLVALAVGLTACGGSTPTAPTTVPRSDVVSAIPTPPAPVFPSLTGPSRTFLFDHSSARIVFSYTPVSRFVLYDNGAFALQYPSGEYRGAYTESNGMVTFSWEGWSAAGAWQAAGPLNDGLLDVHFNGIMQLSDFEDAVYRLVP